MNSLHGVIRQALEEDLGPGDWTTLSIVEPGRVGSGAITAKALGVIAGLPVAEAVFRQLDPAFTWSPAVAEGWRVAAGEVVVRFQGKLAAILQGERVALNFLQRLSGIATLTAQYVEAVQGYRARIADTRKTAPGLRMLDKYAVRVGGGINHRTGLYDAVLIKDNHLRVAGGIPRAVERVRAYPVPFTLKIEVEVTNLDQLREALACGVDMVLLDNMPLDMMRQAVEIVGGRIPVEASGGIALETVRDVAATGVDIISVGALTHSVGALDLSLNLD